MGIKIRLLDWLGRRIDGCNIETIVGEKAAQVYFRELALYIAISYIANTLSKCECKVFEDGKEVKNRLYYALNVSPNPNMSSSQFWNRVVNDYFRKGEVAVIPYRDRLYVADGFSIEERPMQDNLFKNIAVEGKQRPRDYRAEDLFYFKLDHIPARKLIEGAADSYAELLAAAMKAYKRDKGRKYKLALEGIKAGDKEFAKYYDTVLKSQLKEFMEHDNAIYPEYKGYGLSDISPNNSFHANATGEDIFGLRKEIFDITSQALKIPSAMMYGNITSIKNEAKIKYTAETHEFNVTIQSSTSKMKELRAELALNTTELKNGGDQTQLLLDRYEILTRQWDQAGEIVQNLTNKLDVAKRIYGETSNQVAELSAKLLNAENVQMKLGQQINECVSQINIMVNSLGNGQSAFAQMNTLIASQEKELQDLKDQYKEAALQYGENSEEAKQLAAQIVELSGDLQDNRDALESVSAAADSFDQTMQDASAGIIDVSEAVNILQGHLSNVDDKVTDLVTDGLRSLVDLSKEIAVGIVESGMEYETAFTGIKKTVDTGADSVEEAEAQFRLLSDGLREMSEEIPTTRTHLAEIGESGGQVGVQFGESGEILLGFIRTMADLEVATDIAGDTGAEAMGRFAAVTQMSQTEFSNMGSALVATGNRFAATESQILDMSQRLGASATQAGMTQAQITGLSAALVSVGLATDAGGSAFSRVIEYMDVAASTSGKLDAVLKESGMTLRDLELLSANDSKAFKELAQSLDMSSIELNRLVKNGVRLEDFGEVAGMTGKEFKQAFEEDACGALIAFILGLSETNSLGSSATEMLQEMNITELRLSDALRRTTNASELFTSAINVATTAWEENTALAEEATMFYGSTESKMQMLRNTVTNLGHDLFNQFCPAMQSAIDTTKNWLQTTEAQAIIDQIGVVLKDLAENTLANLPAIIQTVSTAAQGIPSVLNGVSTAIQWVVTHIDEIVTGIKAVLAVWAIVKTVQISSSIVQVTASLVALIAQLAATAGAASAATVAQTALNVAMKANVFGVILTAVVALVAGIVKLVQWLGNLGDNTESCNARIQAITSSITPFRDQLASCSPTLTDINGLLSATGQTMADLDSKISQAEQNITNAYATAMQENRQLRADELESIRQWQDDLLALQAEKLGMYRTQQQVQLQQILAEADSISQAGMAQHLTNIQEALTQANQATKQAYDAEMTLLMNKHTQAGTLNSEAFIAERDALAAKYQEEYALNQSYYDQSYQQLLQFSANAISGNQEMWSTVYADSNRGREAFTSNMEQMDADSTEAFLSMWATAKKAGVDIPAETDKLAMDILTSFENLPDSLEEQGKNTLNGLIQGMTSLIPELNDTSEMTCDEIVDTITEGLDTHSPSQVTTKIGEDTAQGLINGLQNKQSVLNSTATTVSNGLVQSLTPDGNKLSTIGQNSIGSLQGGLQAQTSTLNSSAAGIATGVVKALTPNSNSVTGIGENIMTGINSGMNNKSSWLGSKISSLASGLIDKFKAAFKIGSPSKLLADEVGYWIPPGIGEGIESNADAAVMPLQDIVNKMQSVPFAWQGKALEYDVEARVQSHMDGITGGSSQLSVLERMIDSIEHLANRPIYLGVDGVTLARATASANDDVNGTRLNFRERGLALE